ncbi:MAG: YeeE/YedE family protein [Casimicrobiaceae bacterium]
MHIDWNHFTPASAVAGGLLIGLAAAALVLLIGRVAGISGIVGGMMPRRGSGSGNDVVWRIAFIAGMLVAPSIYVLVTALPAISITASYPLLIVAGLLVGVGTRYGGGCTSGHGVCGLSRGSVRSLASTATFMAAGFATVFVVRHVIGASS